MESPLQDKIDFAVEEHFSMRAAIFKLALKNRNKIVREIISHGYHRRKIFAAGGEKKLGRAVFFRKAPRRANVRLSFIHPTINYGVHLAWKQSAGRAFVFKSSWASHSGIVLIKTNRYSKTVRFYFYNGKKIICLHLFLNDLLKISLQERFVAQREAPKKESVLLRAAENPIIQPSIANRWESDAVFNAGALYLDNKVHLIYRAIGESGLSVLGYAMSRNGSSIEERSAEPAFVCEKMLTAEKKNLAPYPYSSGGSWWGSEDPRLTCIDETIYMTYTAFDGHDPPCVALTSISTSDFLHKEWNWKAPRIISQPGAKNKNWVIFPEKINGKFAVLHSITPQVLITYLDSMDFENGRVITSHYQSKGRDGCWDNWMRGVGPPPIRTEDGWLVLYHAMDKNDPDRYKIGAMLLDEKQPEKILFRSQSPLLEPDQWYENDGHKKGVVYTCGAALINQKLFVYYGGSDSFLCAATIGIHTLLRQLRKNKRSSLRSISSRD